ncbi:hypothetical protein N8Z80_04280 [Litorivicinus sp.]|nr:hypothetical protein [Litorivicinus sp.]
MDALTEFNQICDALASTDADQLSEVELNRHAKVLLEGNGFQPGQARQELRNEKIAGSDRAVANQKWFDLEFIEHPMWTDWMDWQHHCKMLEAEARHRKDQEYYRPQTPPELKVLDAAWGLATRSPSNDAMFLWKEFWPLYMKDKNIDLTDNYGRQKQRQWNDFLQFVEGQELTSSTMNRGLRDWLDGRRNGNVTDQTIDK